MKATRNLHELGQSLWLDNITRGLLRTGVLRRYIEELSITGLTSNPTIFDHAIKNSGDYDDAIKVKLAEGKSGEKLFFDVALEDLTQAADLFRPIHDRTCGVDGWVSLEVSPLLAHDTKSTIAVARELHGQARRSNVMIKIPGTPEGLPAIEEAIFAGVPINVTLLFSDDQYLAAASAFIRGIERRIESGLKPDIPSVASIFVSRWDVASTGTKDSKASDVLYVKALAAPFTVNTMPEGTLKALAEHGDIGETIPTDGGNAEDELARFAAAGIDVHALSNRLQDEGAKSFVNSWNDLMDVINSKSAVLKRAG